MAQDLTVNINTTSDVPQAMDKSKTAVVSFSKQVEDIQKKFSTGFKDIFLGFTAPMVLIQSAISAITGAIENAKREAQEGFDLIAKGETIFASSEEKRFAAYLKARKEREAEMEAVKKGKVEITQKFADTPEGAKLGVELAQKYNVAPEGMNAFFKNLANIPEYQQKALEWFLNSAEAKNFEVPENEKLKAGSFKGPEGFGTVVGVGANPVMEKMTHQNELLEDIKNILWEQTQMNHGGQVPDPFTERVPLTMQKAGLS